MRVLNSKRESIQVNHPLSPQDTIPHDPTEIYFRDQSREPFSYQRIVSEDSLNITGSVDLTKGHTLFIDEDLNWDATTMLRLDLWGREVDSVDTVNAEKEVADMKVEKRKRGIRSPSPAVAGSLWQGKLAALAKGMKWLSPLNHNLS